MSTQNLLTITAKNYPNTILLGNNQYDVTFQIVNHSSHPEQFRFHFSMQGISGQIPKKFQSPVILEPTIPHELTIPIVPTANGSGKLILHSNSYKEVKHIEKVYHVRESAIQKRVKEALAKSFIKFNDLTRGNKKLPKFKNGKPLDLESAVIEYEKIYNSSLELYEKDQKLIDLAKRVFYSDHKFSYEILKMVQNQASIQDLLVDLIYATVENDHKLAIAKLYTVQDFKLKDSLLEKLITFILEKDMGLAIQLCKEVTDSEIRDNLLRDIFFFSYLKQFDEALQLISIVNNQHLQLGLYYEVIKIMLKTDVVKCESLIQNLIKKSMLNQEIEILAELLIILSHMHSPQQAVDLISTFPPEVKNAVNKLIYFALWYEVEEEQIRIEEMPLSSLYYAFNVMVKPSPVIVKVAELGGTVSSNLINGEMNSVIGIVNLFSFNFPVYPTIEQCYAEINAEKGKSFYYLIIPLKNADDNVYEKTQNIIKNLFVTHAAQVPHKMYIFNLDFIPYLSKPTIIVEDDPEENIVMQSIVKRVFKNDVSLIIDDGLFKGGKIHQWIQSILPPNKFKLLNMVLTYDFLNNYNLLKNLMNEFVR